VTPEEARTRFSAARVARLATVDERSRPHIVPIVFALDRESVFTTVDNKPKRSRDLRRLRNVATNPDVALLADEYTEAWERLWWARCEGTAEVLAQGSSESQHGIDLLVARYAQYQREVPAGPVVVIRVRRWSGWSAST
jgi:PPOX class probable F420-dependent enzyme